MKLMFEYELEALEKRVREDERQKLETEANRLRRIENELKDERESLSSWHQRLREKDVLVNRYIAEYCAGIQKLDDERRVFKENEERFNAFVESQKAQIQKTTVYLKEKSDELHTELSKLHDYKNEHDFFKWDCERLSEIATKRLHAYQTNRCLFIAYKAALKEAMAGFSSEQCQHIEAIIAENLEHMKEHYKNRNIEATQRAEQIKTKETATDDIHEVDMPDAQELLQAVGLGDNEDDGMSASSRQ